MSRGVRKTIIEIVAVLLSGVIFWVPFYFVIINSFKTRTEASLMNISWPSSFHIWANYKEVLLAQNNMLLRAFYNSTILTVASIVLLVFFCSMAGFVLQRRQDKASPIINFLVLAGLMIPPAIVPTIWVVDYIGLFKTMQGIILIEVALAAPFTIILYRGFMVSIPREIDEAATVDGCNSFRLYFQVIFPLLQPVTATIIVLSAVTIFNDFVNPLYFFPGANNVTVQLTLYNYISRSLNSWNLLFTNVVLISLPPLVLFIFFNKKIVAGMTAGAVKG
ncbi:MAG: transporter [Bacilli bacterium]|nr:transporter [Bacilli bacterium]